MPGLEPGSRRPKHVRQPTTPPKVVVRIQELCEQYPGWGREKLRVLLEHEGIQVSPKSIDRVLPAYLFPVKSLGQFVFLSFSRALSPTSHPFCRPGPIPHLAPVTT